MLKKCKYQRKNGNEKVKLSGCTKLCKLLVHYNIYKEKCVRKKSIKIKKIEMLFEKY
jgi:hypothetical protein